MSSGVTLLLAFCIGVVAGLRSLTAPAVVAWAAHLGWMNLSASPLAFMGSAWAVGIFTLLALLEFVTDQLPRTPARTAAVPLGARFVVAGGTLGSDGQHCRSIRGLSCAGRVSAKPSGSRFRYRNP